MEELFAEAGNWTLSSDQKLLDWMVKFAESVERRCKETKACIDRLNSNVESMDAMMSNTNASIAVLLQSRNFLHKTSSNEETIVRMPPKIENDNQDQEALSKALTAVRLAVQSSQMVRSGCVDEQLRTFIDRQPGLLLFDEPARPIPHVIGSLDFCQDSACGLADAAPHYFHVPPGLHLLPPSQLFVHRSGGGDVVHLNNDMASDSDIETVTAQSQISAEEEENIGTAWSSEDDKIGDVRTSGSALDAPGPSNQVASEPSTFAPENLRALLEAALRGDSDYYKNESVVEENVADVPEAVLSEEAQLQEDYFLKTAMESSIAISSRQTNISNAADSSSSEKESIISTRKAAAVLESSKWLEEIKRPEAGSPDMEEMFFKETLLNPSVREDVHPAPPVQSFAADLKRNLANLRTQKQESSDSDFSGEDESENDDNGGSVPSVAHVNDSFASVAVTGGDSSFKVNNTRSMEQPEKSGFAPVSLLSQQVRSRFDSLFADEEEEEDDIFG